MAHGKKEGCLTWDEFLNFFFLKEASLLDRIDGNDWWNKIDQEGHKIETKRTPVEDITGRTNASPDSDDSNDEGRRMLKEWKEVPMTPALEMLMKSRRVKTEQEVEDDFNNRQKIREMGGAPSPPGKSKKTNNSTTQILDEEAMNELGFGKREKSQNLLLPSHVETMREVYERLDKYNDRILKRSDFLMALRTDERVVDFIDVDAVKVASAKAKILTLDNVLVEVERDEAYEMMQMSRQEDAINHKEFITWREFLSYFEDYQEIEARNKKSKTIENTRAQIQGKKAAQETVDPQEEMQSLLE